MRQFLATEWRSGVPSTSQLPLNAVWSFTVRRHDCHYPGTLKKGSDFGDQPYHSWLLQVLQSPASSNCCHRCVRWSPWSASTTATTRSAEDQWWLGSHCSIGWVAALLAAPKSRFAGSHHFCLAAVVEYAGLPTSVSGVAATTLIAPRTSLAN